MRIAVTGSQGQVVQALLEIGAKRGVEVVAVGRPTLDLAEPGTVGPALAAARPDVIVSAAAYTAVDKAEADEAAAFAINAAGAGAVAGAAAALGVPVIHLSTDYVFAGDKAHPYRESDETAPTSVYGRSKLAGEAAVSAATPDHTILRTAWVYSPFGANFVKTMLRSGATRDVIRVVHDQRGCPTSALDIAGAVITIAGRLAADPDPALRGIFHLSGEGEASWAEFAAAIFTDLETRTGRIVTVEPITTAEYPTPAKRPANSRLDTARLSGTYGIRLPPWRHSLATTLDRLCAASTERHPA